MAQATRQRTQSKKAQTIGRTEANLAVEADLPNGLQNATPINYPIAGASITALQVYHNPKRQPEQDGPWRNEADKVSWVDDATGFGCIMLRQEDGTLSGYVGVGLGHPLYGFEAEAVPLSISSVVHGGVTYGQDCEVNRTELRAKGKPRQERYTVCHVTRTRWVQDHEEVQTTSDQFPHEDLWWLGFDTNHVGDLIPGDPYHTPRKSDVYRDQGYVYEQCILLAECLKELADRQVCGHATTGYNALPPSTNEGR